MNRYGKTNEIPKRRDFVLCQEVVVKLTNNPEYNVVHDQLDNCIGERQIPDIHNLQSDNSEDLQRRAHESPLWSLELPLV